MKKNNTSMETSPLTQELYSIDWAVRFDEFRQYDQSSYTDLHQLLTKIESLVESEVAKDIGDLNDIKVLTTQFNKAKSGSVKWHHLSMLIHLRIIQAAIPKGLTATATLSAIQIMEHIWKIVAHSDEGSATTSKPVTAKTNKTTSAKKPVAQVAPQPSPRNKQTEKQAVSNKKPAAKPAPKPAAKAAAKNANNKKVEAKTENVVIKKLAAEAGLDDEKILEARCYEVASSLADEYPEYTLTAIRVMTAEKLGVTRQFVENLDIKPARFKNG